MDWIKRNLYFLIGSVVALALMGLAGWFLFSKYQDYNAAKEKLNADYAELDRLNKQTPHPGSGEVDNIKTAKEQQQQLRGYMDNARKNFERIAPIPEVAKLTDQDFFAALSRAIYQLQRDATNASVVLLPNYNFSFEAQTRKLTFAAGSLDRLAVQLGEVKTICDVLFQAKINNLDNLRRERVSADDAAGPQTDYLTEKSTTNELAVITPYEVTFRCFSAELASVLTGFAGSPHGLLIKTVNVEAAPVTAADPGLMPAAYAPTSPAYTPQSTTPAASVTATYSRRYGSRYGGGGGGAANVGGVQLREGPAPTPTYVAPVVQPGAPAAGASAHGGMPTVLDEKQLKVTLTLNVVKPLPANPAK